MGSLAVFKILPGSDTLGCQDGSGLGTLGEEQESVMAWLGRGLGGGTQCAPPPQSAVGKGIRHILQSPGVRTRIRD